MYDKPMPLCRQQASVERLELPNLPRQGGPPLNIREGYRRPRPEIYLFPILMGEK